ncbi:MAG TPA: hypothetical protein VE439_09145 [Anaerolineae bacterium]|jgi:hypothetical protein|nr:hypothetical protein [Anaerolineae bacterium]
MGLRESKAYKRIKIIVIAVTILYVIMGLVLSLQAIAQPFESVITTGVVNKVPTGNDDKAIEAYYNYLAQSRFMTLHQTFIIAAPSLGWTYGVIGAFLILFFFFAYVWYARHARSDLYPVESYNGYITERSGPVDSLNWAFYAIVGSFMLYYMVIQIVYGQLY